MLDCTTSWNTSTPQPVSGPQSSLPYDHRWNPTLQTYPAHCGSPQLSVDYTLPDWQEAADEAEKNPIQHPNNQHLRPPAMCVLPSTQMTAPQDTYLLNS